MGISIPKTINLCGNCIINKGWEYDSWVYEDTEIIINPISPYKDTYCNVCSSTDVIFSTLKEGQAVLPDDTVYNTNKVIPIYVLNEISLAYLTGTLAPSMYTKRVVSNLIIMGNKRILINSDILYNLVHFINFGSRKNTEELLNVRFIPDGKPELKGIYRLIPIKVVPREATEPVQQSTSLKPASNTNTWEGEEYKHKNKLLNMLHQTGFSDWTVHSNSTHMQDNRETTVAEGRGHIYIGLSTNTIGGCSPSSHIINVPLTHEITVSIRQEQKVYFSDGLDDRFTFKSPYTSEVFAEYVYSENSIFIYPVLYDLGDLYVRKALKEILSTINLHITDPAKYITRYNKIIKDFKEQADFSNVDFSNYISYQRGLHEDALEKAVKSESGYLQRYEKSARVLADQIIVCEAFELRKTSLQSRWGNELSAINKMDKVKNISVDHYSANTTISIVLKDIVCFTSAGGRYSLGDILCSISLGKNYISADDVHLTSLNFNESLPHCNGGNVCWGTALEPVDTFLRKGELENLVNYIISFVETADPFDAWGSHVANFPPLPL